MQAQRVAGNECVERANRVTIQLQLGAPLAVRMRGQLVESGQIEGQKKLVQRLTILLTTSAFRDAETKLGQCDGGNSDITDGFRLQPLDELGRLALDQRNAG